MPNKSLRKKYRKKLRVILVGAQKPTHWSFFCVRQECVLPADFFWYDLLATHIVVMCSFLVLPYNVLVQSFSVLSGTWALLQPVRTALAQMNFDPGLQQALHKIMEQKKIGNAEMNQTKDAKQARNDVQVANEPRLYHII